jgi:hypothetical protein
MEAFDVSVDQGSQKFAAFSGPERSGQEGRSSDESQRSKDLEPVLWNVRGDNEKGLDLYA